MAQSGYTNCRCRDCMEIAISDDWTVPAFCHECEAAGCDGEGECQAPGAYDGYCRECGTADDLDDDGRCQLCAGLVRAEEESDG